jgi:hypothetical protein
MNLDSNVLITAVSTVAAGAFSGLFALLAARSTDRVVKLQETLTELRAAHKKALEQVESYHTLEGLFAAELELNNAGRANAIKTEFRNRVETQGFVRPTMTAGEARHAIVAL